MPKYVVSIRKSSGANEDVTVDADSNEQARRMARGLHHGTVNGCVELDEENYPITEPTNPPADPPESQQTEWPPSQQLPFIVPGSGENDE